MPRWPQYLQPARARLGQDIVAGVYPPETLLPNAIDMCQRFSVSRTALREAYSILSAKALIVARPRIGTRVRRSPNGTYSIRRCWRGTCGHADEHFVDDLFVLRQMVEPHAAALAASSARASTAERIAEAYGRMDRFKNGAGDLIGADLDFHMAILEASGNRFLNALGGMIHTALECTFRLSWQGAERIQDDRLFQHRAIFEAIRDRAPELARDRMAELFATRSRTCGNISGSATGGCGRSRRRARRLAERAWQLRFSSACAPSRMSARFRCA